MKPTLLYFFGKVKKMQAAGEKVLGFTLTTPEFPPPAWLEQEVAKVYKDSFPYLPSGGDFVFRQQLADFYSTKWKRKFKEENVFVGTGGKEILYILLTLLLKKPGGEIIVISPYWATYPNMVELLKGKIKIVKALAKDDFYPDMDKIAKAVTAKTRAVIITSPNNPTGKVIKEKDVKFLADLAKKKNFVLICDEVYEIYNYDNLYVSALKYFNKNVFCVFSASKTFSLCGWRLGWSVGDKDITKGMIAIQSEATTSPNSISQLAFRNLFKDTKKLETYFAENMARGKKRRDLAVAAFKKAGVEYAHPEGCIAIFVKIPKEFDNSFDFCTELLNKEKISMAPGEIFGEKKYFRMNLAVSMPNLKEGLRRVLKYYGN